MNRRRTFKHKVSDARPNGNSRRPDGRTVSAGWAACVMVLAAAGLMASCGTSDSAHDGRPAAAERPSAAHPTPVVSRRPQPSTQPAESRPVAPEPDVAVPESDTADQPAAHSAPALTEEEQDRALRREQIEAVRALATAFPRDASAVFLLGMAYYEQGNSIEAAKHFEQSLQIDPRRADACDYLGRIAFRTGDYEKSLGLSRKAAEMAPRLGGVHYRIAKVLVQMGRADEAIPQLQKDLKAPADTGRTYQLLGESWFQLKQYEKARQSYEAAVRVNPDLAKAYYGLATTCARLKLPKKSKEYQQKFKQLEAAGQAAGRHWRHTYDPLKLTRESTAHTHTDVGRVYLAHGSARDAERFWRRAAEIDANNVDCRFHLASLRQRQGRLSAAIELYGQIIESDPNSGVAFLLRGNVRLRQVQFDEAERDFKQVIEVSPERSEGYRALAGLYLRLERNVDEAKTLSAKAAKLHPIAPNFALCAAAREKAGDLLGALVALRRATELAPGNADYRQMYERIQRKLQDESP